MHRGVSHKSFFSVAEVNMTRGSILTKVLFFAFPLLLGNVFQQLYNMVDTVVVGNYVGKAAYSAVGTLGPVTNAIIGFFLGFSSGAGVVISRYYGAEDYQRVKKTVYTFIVATLSFCFLITVVGLISVPLMITILGSPSEVAKEQSLYLTIYFSGVSGLLIYNMGSAVLRAVGNSGYPFFSLVVCTVLNIILDLLFVTVFKMGTEGVAYATVISQFVSAAMVVLMLLRTKSVVRISVKEIRPDFRVLKEIMFIGLPSAFQLSVTSFSNVFVQSYINYFGVDVMGGWAAYSKIDQLFFLPMQSLSLAAATFVGQNLGAGNIKRARKGVWIVLLMALISTFVLILPVMFAAESMVSIFIDNSEHNVIYYGALFLRLNGPFFLVACINNVFGSALRGAGKSLFSMIHMLSCFVIFRQIYLYVMKNYIGINTVESVGISYPIGWILCSILMLVSFFLIFPRTKTVLENK